MHLTADKFFEHGTVISGAGKSYNGSVEVGEANDLAISWKDQNGVEYMRNIVVTGEVLRDKRMRVFTITPTMEIEQSWRWDE